MAELSLRYMQVQISAKTNEGLPGVELINYFDKFEFLSLIEVLPNGMHCIVLATYDDPSVLDLDYNSYELIRKIEVRDKSAILEIKTLGPIPKIFTQLSGAWWISPTYVDADGLLLTIRGTSDSLRKSLENLTELVGQSYKVKSSSKTLHNPTIVSDLPNKQKEVLQKAIQMGYYSRPRKTTQKAIADALGVKQATISEHLQNAEANIIADYTKHFEI